MNSNRLTKTNEVKEILEKIQNSKSMVVATYAGLTVSELQELRKELREANVEIKVFKNRLVKIALKDTDFSEMSEVLVGPNIYAFGMESDIAPAKIIAKFAKDHKKMEIVAGTYEGKVVDKAGVIEVATLPTLEEALTKLALAMLTPIKDLGIGLNMLVEDGHLKDDATKEGE